jgi:hypothetical protein
MYTGEGGHHEHLIIMRQEYNLRGTSEASDETSNWAYSVICASVCTQEKAIST